MLSSLFCAIIAYFFSRVKFGATGKPIYFTGNLPILYGYFCHFFQTNLPFFLFSENCIIILVHFPFFFFAFIFPFGIFS